jgi:hypothetical protein
VGDKFWVAWRCSLALFARSPTITIIITITITSKLLDHLVPIDVVLHFVVVL